MSRDPSPIGDLIGPLLQGFGIARPRDAATLIERWAEVAGDPWAERGRPVHLRDGELVVEVANGGTAWLLKYQTADLIGRIDTEFGKGLVTSVRIRPARGRSRGRY